MRKEKKFRFWRGKTWNVPNHFCYFTLEDILGEDESRDPFSGGDELTEYTGLNDVNGKEIYEGDIVEYDSYYNPEIDDESDYNPIIYKVAFTNNCHGEKWGWDLVDKNGGCHNYYYGGFNPEYTKVVGNIYQNENLLNGTNS